jgi:hypothetical protein
MRIGLFILLYISLTSTYSFANQSAQCLEGAIQRTMAQSKNISAKIADAYFNDIHSDSTQNCFEAKKGDVLKMTKVQQSHGTVIKIRDSTNDVYQVIDDEAYLNFSGPNSATLSEKYFKNNKAKKCFSLNKGSSYQITSMHRVDRVGMMAEVRDPVSGLYQWFPLYRLEVTDSTIEKQCPNLDTTSSQGGATARPE